MGQKASLILIIPYYSALSFFPLAARAAGTNPWTLKAALLHAGWLNTGTSWPHTCLVHKPDRHKHALIKKGQPEVQCSLKLTPTVSGR